MKKFFNEFKQFVSRGSVIDMAVGIIIGSAFTSIVNSLVKDIINPLIGIVTGGIDFGNLNLTLRAASETKPELTLNYGAFISAVINFLIVAFVLFVIIKVMNNTRTKLAEKLKKQQEDKKAESVIPPVIPEDVLLLREIRDSLKNGK